MKKVKIALSALLSANLFCACSTTQNTTTQDDTQDETQEENTVQEEETIGLEVNQYTNLYEAEPIWADTIYVDFYGISAQNKSDDNYDVSVQVDIQNEGEEEPYLSQTYSLQVPAHSFVYWGSSDSSNGVDGLKPNATTLLSVSYGEITDVNAAILSLDQVQFEEIDDDGTKSISYTASTQNSTDQTLQLRALVIFLKDDQPVYMAEGELNTYMLESGETADIEGSVSSDLAPEYDEVVLQITGIYA